jgi:methionyl-tRNA formyltransferase
MLERKVRAFDPTPGARFVLGGDAVKVWAAELVAGTGQPGTVRSVSTAGIEVACGKDSVRLLTVQPPGGKRMTAGAFAAGRRLVAGTRLA